MVAINNLVDKVKKLFTKTKNAITSPIAKATCTHVFKEIGQKWDQIGKRRFQLKRRFSCTNCKTERLEIIGDK